MMHLIRILCVLIYVKCVQSTNKMTSDGLTSVTGMKDEDLDVVGLKQEYQVSSVMSPMPTVFIFRLHVDIYYRFNKKKTRKTPRILLISRLC